LTITDAPSAARPRAVAKPIPAVEPVTSAFLALSCRSINLPLNFSRSSVDAECSVKSLRSEDPSSVPSCVRASRVNLSYIKGRDESGRFRHRLKGGVGRLRCSGHSMLCPYGTLVRQDMARPSCCACVLPSRKEVKRAGPSQRTLGESLRDSRRARRYERQRHAIRVRSSAALLRASAGSQAL
jgi:hypothetical protein